MSTYVTVVKWSRAMDDAENQSVIDYINTQTVGNGIETAYEGSFARSWVDEAAAVAFCDFAKALQQNQKIPTKTALYTVD